MLTLYCGIYGENIDAIMMLLSSHKIIDISAANAWLQSGINNGMYLRKCTFFFGFALRFNRHAVPNVCEMIIAFRYVCFIIGDEQELVSHR